MIHFVFIHLFKGLGQIENQLRGNLIVCPSGRQLVLKAQHCGDANHCLGNFIDQNCSSGNMFCRTASYRVK